LSILDYFSCFSYFNAAYIKSSCINKRTIKFIYPVGNLFVASTCDFNNGINGICKLQTGHKISINIPDKFNKGDNLTIFIRPERIKINKSKSSSLSQIQEFTYLGNAAHIELLSNGVSVNATLPIDKVKNFKKGDKIEIEFPKNYSQIINS